VLVSVSDMRRTAMVSVAFMPALDKREERAA